MSTPCSLCGTRLDIHVIVDIISIAIRRHKDYVIFLVFFVCSQIELNNIVGYEIDSLEARKYRLFTDIDEFESARFYEYDDSIIVRMTYLKNGVSQDSAVSINPEIFKTLNSYIRNYRLIIEDEQFRISFIETFRIDWPIVSQNDIEQVVKSTRGRQLFNTACCMTGACALGAYAAAFLTRNIRTEIHMDTVLVPCWTGGNGWGCMTTTVPVVYKYYSINPAAYVGGAALGSGVGYLASKKTYTPNRILFEALALDVVAFDHAGYPITEQEIIEANKGTNEALFATLGLAVGFAGSAITAIALLSSWTKMEPDKDWHRWAVNVPIILISGAELVVITRYFLGKGKQFDRRATIERLKEHGIDQ